MNTHENHTDNKSQTRFLTQEEVDKQIRYYIAPLTRQLQDLARLIQRMSTAHRPNLSPRAGTALSSSAAGPSPDIFPLLPEPDTEFGASKLQKVKSLQDFPWCRTCQLAKKACQPIPRIRILSLIIVKPATPMKKHCHGPKTKPSMVPNEISAQT